MQRHLGGLGERADEQQQAAGDQVGAVVREHVRRGRERPEELERVPVWRKMKNVPSTSPTSPSTLITNALIPADVAVVRRYQNEISM